MEIEGYTPREIETGVTLVIRGVITDRELLFLSRVGRLSNVAKRFNNILMWKFTTIKYNVKRDKFKAFSMRGEWIDINLIDHGNKR